MNTASTTADFGGSSRETTASPALWQFDYGQTLAVTGLGALSARIVSVHFETEYTDSAIVMAGMVYSDGLLLVDIPDGLMRTASPWNFVINAYIHVVRPLEGTPTSGTTIYKVKIPVKLRDEQNPPAQSQAQASAWDAAIAEAGEMVDELKASLLSGTVKVKTDTGLQSTDYPAQSKAVGDAIRSLEAGYDAAIGDIHTVNSTQDGRLTALESDVAGFKNGTVSVAMDTGFTSTALPAQSKAVGDAIRGISNGLDAAISDIHGVNSTQDGRLTTIERDVADLKARPSSDGSPLVAETAAGMTNTDRIYLYVGSETGYTAGDLYYYNGTAWVDGGPYSSASVDIDSTLSIAGKAADAKAAGDAIVGLTRGSISAATDQRVVLSFEGGGMYASTGINYGSSSRWRSGFVRVYPGEEIQFTFTGTSEILVLQFADNTTTTETNNVRVKHSYRPSSGTNGPVTMQSTTNYIRVQIEADPSQCEVYFTRAGAGRRIVEEKPVILTYPTLSDVIQDTGVLSGQIVRTMGFSSYDDFGGGLYYILNSGTPDNCTIFALSNGLYAHRVFNEPFVYLESLNFPTVSIGFINTICEENGIYDVRCNNITISTSIVLGKYDLTFKQITYTGSDFAVILDGIVGRNVTGYQITATNGSCIKLTSTAGSCNQNNIQINRLKAKDIGLGIFPTAGNGISHNFYKIRRIDSGLYGVRSYIPANTGKYSWEGEEVFSISQVTATNTNGTGIAVSLQIDTPSSGVTTDGTITGLSFLHLAVEGSDTGIDIRCGSINSSNSDACIKSIFINNLRGRETWGNIMWMTGHGYIRDVVVRTTAPTRIFQWDLQTSAGNDPCIVEGPICYNNQIVPIADGLMFRLNKKYARKRLTGIFNVTQDTDFSELGVFRQYSETTSYWRQMFFCSAFSFDESLRGSTVSLNLTYFLDDTADGLKFIIPGATQADGAIVAKIKYYSPQKEITLTNSSADTHVYQINVLRTGLYWDENVRFIVKDLGVPDYDAAVAHNYVEPEEQQEATPPEGE